MNHPLNHGISVHCYISKIVIVIITEADQDIEDRHYEPYERFTSIMHNSSKDNNYEYKKYKIIQYPTTIL